MNPNQLRELANRCIRAVRRHAFYLSLGACLLLLGGALMLARARMNAPTPPPTPTPAPAQASSSLDERLAQRQDAPTLHWPVAGRELLTPHSPDEPTWSDTLSLWQTHVGVDIAAVKGEVVRAAAAGTVTRAGRDALLGNVVEVTGADGVLTRYANLATSQLVKEGDRVRAGDALGAVGDSSALEAGLQAHLHFEAWNNGEWLALP
ncbi:MAG: M23 family metallopeptidase [Eubacteriales bacterium]|nr:M23 family metallopeptidase [Christensenellaceae bacterium]MEA5065002.1 M23 family metallopeptidase [Eubacteriales bacterium]